VADLVDKHLLASETLHIMEGLGLGGDIQALVLQYRVVAEVVPLVCTELEIMPLAQLEGLGTLGMVVPLGAQEQNGLLLRSMGRVVVAMGALLLEMVVRVVCTEREEGAVELVVITIYLVVREDKVSS
jgi:hypothetical protein